MGTQSFWSQGSLNSVEVRLLGAALPRGEHCPRLDPGMRAWSQGLAPGSAQAHAYRGPTTWPALPPFICEMG